MLCLKQYKWVFHFRAVTLKEELKTKSSALSDIQKQLEYTEQDRAAVMVNLDKVNQEHAKLDKKAQTVEADLQKAQQEKEAQRKQLLSMQESLGKANKALKESESLLDTERKNHKTALEEKVCSGSSNIFPFLSCHTE